MVIQKKKTAVDDCSLHCSIPAAHPPPFFPNTPFLAHIFFAHPATFVFTHLFWHRYFLHTLQHLFAQTSIFGTHIFLHTLQLFKHTHSFGTDIFRCASISSTYPCMSVRPSVRKSYFRISILSVSLVALREKLKREDPNYFSILGLGKISRNWSGVGGVTVLTLKFLF